MENKLESIEKHLASMDITLAKQEIHLAEHMRRSLANEKAIEGIRKQMWAWAITMIATLVGVWLHK